MKIIQSTPAMQLIKHNNTLKCVPAKKTAYTGRAKRTPFS
jgi:hypothetical protein